MLRIIYYNAETSIEKEISNLESINKEETEIIRNQDLTIISSGKSELNGPLPPKLAM